MIILVPKNKKRAKSQISSKSLIRRLIKRKESFTMRTQTVLIVKHMLDLFRLLQLANSLLQTLNLEKGIVCNTSQELTIDRLYDHSA